MDTINFATYPETVARARVSIEHRKRARELGYDSDKARACMLQELHETVNRDLNRRGYERSIPYAKA